MTLLTWTEENSVKVEEIDNQHKKVFTMINHLYEIVGKPEFNDEKKLLLQNLINYSKEHFATEEKYFELFEYEGAEDHIGHHKMYTKKMNEFVEKSRGETGNLMSFELMDFLHAWWEHHVQTEDKKYSKCFNDHGLH